MSKKNRKPKKAENKLATIFINALIDLVVGTLLILIAKWIG